jgi:hypothetical protein
VAQNQKMTTRHGPEHAAQNPILLRLLPKVATHRVPEHAAGNPVLRLILPL